jgi:branched-chain amino acid transport system permease protein
MIRRFGPYLALLVAALAIIALSFGVGEIGSYDRRIVLMIGINMILATSLNLINGFTGQFSLGHAGFMGVGAYASAVVTTIVAPETFGSEPSGIGQSMLFIGPLIAGGLAAALAGLLVGIPSLRLKGDYLAIVTLGFGEIIRVIIQNVPEIGGSLGLANIPAYTNFVWIFLTLAILVFIIQNLMRSTYGKGFLAVRDDEIAAEASGIDTTRYKVAAFVIGAFFAGVAGGLYGHFNGLVRPDDFGFLRSVEIVVMVILGGMGSTYGVLFAAAILTYLPEWLREVHIGSLNLGEFRMSIYALVLVILMLLRPQGLFGDFRLLRFVRALRTRKQAEEPVIRG